MAIKGAGGTSQALAGPRVQVCPCSLSSCVQINCFILYGLIWILEPCG